MSNERAPEDMTTGSLNLQTYSQTSNIFSMMTICTKNHACCVEKNKWTKKMSFQPNGNVNDSKESTRWSFTERAETCPKDQLSEICYSKNLRSVGRCSKNSRNTTVG